MIVPYSDHFKMFVSKYPVMKKKNTKQTSSQFLAVNQSKVHSHHYFFSTFQGHILYLVCSPQSTVISLHQGPRSCFIFSSMYNLQSIVIILCHTSCFVFSQQFAVHSPGMKISTRPLAQASTNCDFFMQFIRKVTCPCGKCCQNLVFSLLSAVHSLQPVVPI